MDSHPAANVAYMTVDPELEGFCLGVIHVAAIV